MLLKDQKGLKDKIGNKVQIIFEKLIKPLKGFNKRLEPNKNI